MHVTGRLGFQVQPHEQTGVVQAGRCTIHFRSVGGLTRGIEEEG